VCDVVGSGTCKETSQHCTKADLTRRRARRRESVHYRSQCTRPYAYLARRSGATEGKGCVVLTNGPRGPGGEGVGEEMHDAMKTGSEQRKTMKHRLQVCLATACPTPPHRRLWSSRRAALSRAASVLLLLSPLLLLFRRAVVWTGDGFPRWLGLGAPRGGGGGFL
jgi:hypothetical protein